MENGEKWRPMGGGSSLNPSARLKAARSMPPWMQSRAAAFPAPPPPPMQETSVDPDYEVIEFPGQTYSNTPIQEIKHRVDGKKCDLCGSSAPSVNCTVCTQNFCPSCDDMYHRHPKRQTHIRKDLDGRQIIVRPPLPPKGEAAPPPVPPPRRNKRNSRTPLPPDPHDQTKVGFVGSLKRMVGARPLPAAPFQPNGPMGHPNQFPPQMMGYPAMPDWEMKNRSGSFSNLQSLGFNPIMQAQSMAHLNNCQPCYPNPHGGMWDPWRGNVMGPPPVGPPQWGIPPNNAWQSTTLLHRRPSQESFRRNSLRRNVRESSSGSEDERIVQNRRRNTSPALSRRSRNPRSDYESEEEEEPNRDWEKHLFSQSIPRRASMADGINRTRQDDDTLSVHGRIRNSTLTRRESTGNNFERIPRRDFDRTLERRNSRRNDFELNQRRYEPEPTPRTRRRMLNDHRQNFDDGRSSRGSHRISDFEDSPDNGSRTEQNFMTDDSDRSKSRRNEFGTGRRRTSISSKYKDNNFDNITQKSSEEDNKNGMVVADNEEEEEELGPIPETQWECAHCTFINEAGTRVCSICCKTTSKPKPSKESTKNTIMQKPKDFGIKRETRVVKDYDQVIITEGLKNTKIDQSTRQSPKSQATSPMNQRKGINTGSRKNLTSTGTSPPPQSISTQTYDVTGHKLKRATSLADYAEWRAPQRSYSRQSLFSDTQSLPVTPPKGRSPERYNQEAIPPEQPVSRKNSEQILVSQRNVKRAGSQPPDYISTLVQKQVKQGLEMVKLLREAEEHQFSADDLAVALLHCEDGDPVAWLQQNWRNMIDTVVTLGTNYGHERKENIVGTISASEARDALRIHDGNVWAAVTECVEQRQKKYAELLSRGNFSREDIVTVLTANHGNLEAAYMELSKSQLKPFLMRIWGPPQGTDNESGNFTKLAHGTEWEGGRCGRKDEEVSLISSENNNDRIQTWLDNYVHKPKLTQSMLQLNSISSKNSDYSDFQISTKYQNSKKERRYSDVHRYLTHQFTSKNSLQIEPKEEPIKPVEKINSLNEFLMKNLSPNSVVQNIESTQDNSNTLETNTQEIANNIEQENIESNSESESNEEESNSDVPQEIASISSSESYESLEVSTENSEDEENNTLQNDPGFITNKLNEESDNINVEGAKNTEPENLKVELINTGETKNLKVELKNSEGTKNLKLEELKNTEQPKNLKVEELTRTEEPVNFKIEELKNNEEPKNLKIEDLKNNEEPKNLKVEDLKNTEEPKNLKIEELKNTEEPKNLNIEVQNINVGEPKKGNVVETFPTKQLEDISVESIPNENILDPIDDEETEIITVKLPIKIPVKEIIEGENSQNSVANSVAEITNIVNEMLNENFLNDDKIYENVPIENNIPVIVENNQNLEDSHISSDLPTAIRLTDSKSPIMYTSDANSDLDISPIPTDSEKEQSSLEQKAQKNESLKNSSDEIVNLLKESLSKDDVVERIVSSLFQSVLKASVGLQQFPIDPNRVLNRRHSRISIDSRNTSDFEESDNFFEAEESQERQSGTSVGSENTSIASGTKEINPLNIENIDNLEILNIQNIEGTTELNQQNEIVESNEREVRRILAEGLVRTYSQAELVVKLKDLNFDEEQSIAAAAECDNVETALAFLQQECYLCAGKYSMKQMTSMLLCEHICCEECACNYFTLQITERTINDCVCPFCKEPDIGKLEEDKALHYFSNLDIMLKALVKENVHELFQRKLRDRTLMQDPNFVWCGQCSSGFIANPRQKRLICPDCKHISCAACRKTWQKEHEKMTCQEFKDWLEFNDPENQLERHLAENGVTCPKCKTRYVLGKGGCMHLTCPHCKYEFCQGCGEPFLMGNNCKVSNFCEKLGLHSHHPRNCLFYLRDKEPADLQRLLEENGIDYRKNNENVTKRCNVQLLKETDDGVVEAICGFPIESCGLCRTHYIEHLVCLIRNNKLDPVIVMDMLDAQQELRRHGKPLPTREDYKSDHEYLAVCMKVIREHIPLA